MVTLFQMVAVDRKSLLGVFIWVIGDSSRRMAGLVKSISGSLSTSLVKMVLDDAHVTPDEDTHKPPPEKHNAFTAEPSAEALVRKKAPFPIIGKRPLARETPNAFITRRAFEITYIRNESRKELKKSLTKISLLLLFFLIGSESLITVLSLILEGLALPDTPMVTALENLALYTLLYPVFFSVILFAGNFGETHGIRASLRKPDCSPAYLLKTIVLFIGIAYIAADLIDYAISFFELMTGIDIYTPALDFVPYTTWAEPLADFISLCVYAPIFEELLFRGAMLSHHRKFGDWSAVIITSIFFGLFHQNYSQAVYTCAGAVIIAVATLKTKSLIPAMLSHFTLNVIAFIQTVSLSLVTNAAELLDGSAMMPEGSPFAVALFWVVNLLPRILMLSAAIILIVDLIAYRKNYSLEKGNSRLTSADKLSATVTTPAFIATVSVALLLMTFIAFVYPMLT